MNKSMISHNILISMSILLNLKPFNSKSPDKQIGKKNVLVQKDLEVE
jgi:hypothetical protein